MYRYCGEKILNLVTMLLPDDQSDVVVKMASKISERMAEEKVLNWLNKHISAGRINSSISCLLTLFLPINTVLLAFKFY